MEVQHNGALTGAWSIAANRSGGGDHHSWDPSLADAKESLFNFPKGRIKASCKPMVRKGEIMSYTAFAALRALIALSALTILVVAWRKNGGKS